MTSETTSNVREASKVEVFERRQQGSQTEDDDVFEIEEIDAVPAQSLMTMRS